MEWWRRREKARLSESESKVSERVIEIIEWMGTQSHEGVSEVYDRLLKFLWLRDARLSLWTLRLLNDSMGRRHVTTACRHDAAT